MSRRSSQFGWYRESCSRPVGVRAFFIVRDDDHAQHHGARTAGSDQKGGEQAMDTQSPTTLLYATDSYLRTFEARVVATEGHAVALDQTAFYPGGGGQMA